MFSVQFVQGHGRFSVYRAPWCCPGAAPLTILAFRTVEWLEWLRNAAIIAAVVGRNLVFPNI
jgi:hypothetical protein